MDEMPSMTREEFLAASRMKVDETLGKVADAVNDAPAGRVIRDSEQKIFDLFAKLKQEAYELALQMRVDAAEAAFSPLQRNARRERRSDTRGVRVIAS